MPKKLVKFPLVEPAKFFEIAMRQYTRIGRKSQRPTALSSLTNGPWLGVARVEQARAREIKPNPTNMVLPLCVEESGEYTHLAGKE